MGSPSTRSPLPPSPRTRVSRPLWPRAPRRLPSLPDLLRRAPEGALSGEPTKLVTFVSIAGVEIEDPGGVGLGARLHRARKLVMPVGLRGAAEVLERAAECVMRVVVGRRELLDDRPELALGVLPAGEAEVGDPEGLPDRRLLRLEPLRLLERHGRLGRHPCSQPLLSFAEELVGVAHDRYGKFSRTRSTGLVRPRVRPTWIADTSAPAPVARAKTSRSSYGGLPGSGSRHACTF